MLISFSNFHLLAGRRRQFKAVSFSDDEGEEEEEKPDFTSRPLNITEATRAMAIKWLRTARARVQSRGGGGDPNLRAARGPSRKPGDKSRGEKKEN